MSLEQKVFLELVRAGLWESQRSVSGFTFQDSSNVNWQQVKSLADAQGLTAVVLDGLNVVHDSGSLCSKSEENLGENLSNSKLYTLNTQLKLEWIGDVLQDFEARYKQYVKAIGSLAGWYNEHGFKMMVLKGYACSLDWPKPEHRPCGDIDIWLFNQQAAADKELLSSFRVQGSKSGIDNSHHHHTVFEWKGYTVENHYDFINVHHHRSHVKLEKVLKELGMDDSLSVELSVESLEPGERGEKRVESVPVYLPSANLHALFLLKHAALHFVGTELTFRQILDWAFFVEKHGKDVDWKMLLPIIEEHGMLPFLYIINAICVGELGFDARLFPIVQFNPDLKERVVEEIFASVYDGDKNSNIFSRNLNRYRRWKGNAWKHELCYKESMWSAFWSGVWGHLMKPSSI